MRVTLEAIFFSSENKAFSTFEFPVVGAPLQSPSRQFGAVKEDLASKALGSQMPSVGYWDAVRTSNDLNFSQGSSRVLTVSHTDPLAQRR